MGDIVRNVSAGTWFSLASDPGVQQARWLTLGKLYKFSMLHFILCKMGIIIVMIIIITIIIIMFHLSELRWNSKELILEKKMLK